MRSLRILLALLGVALALPALLTTVAAPAQAAPAQVRPPWVSASNVVSGKATLTVRWPRATGAYRYEIIRATDYGMTKYRKVQRTSTSGTAYTLTGLRAKQMYCLQVRAVAKSGSKGAWSQRHCKMTMHRANVVRNQLRMATFNVCGYNSACNKWSWNERAKQIRNRIDSAAVDVVALQETHSRYRDQDGDEGLPDLLRPSGLTMAPAGYFDKEIIFYRPSVLRLVDSGHSTLVRLRGTPVTAAWAKLQYVAGASAGKQLLVTSAHLSNANTATGNNERKVQTQALVRLVQSKDVDSRTGDQIPSVVAGDFNSSRRRSYGDGPGQVLAAAGWYDAYDRSATYTNPYYNSANGYVLTPARGIKYGDHIDRLFIQNATGSAGWKVVASVSGGRYTTPMASDHNPVRSTLYLW